MDMDPESITHRKALELNLDPTKYGTFAEIGAGQEVADWFLSVGGASGTVAQTICAYDKAFSDERYGPGTRYVSRERLLTMLEREYQTLETQLRAARGSQVRFFAFADTVAAKSFKGDNEQHGWIGLRFQAASGSAPSDILLHVALRDHEVEQQRTALGILGVNLVHAAYRQPPAPEPFLRALFENLSIERLEIDVIELDGPAFTGQDARLWCVEALRQGIARAVLLDTSGKPEQPSTLLRKRALVVEGRVRHTDSGNSAPLVSAAIAQLRREEKLEAEPLLLLDVRLADLATSGLEGAALGEWLRSLASRGPVVLTEHPMLYPVVEYLRRYTSHPVRVLASSAILARLVSETYAALPGTLLESLGKLLVQNLRLYIHPVSSEVFLREMQASHLERVGAVESARSIGLDELRCAAPLDHLVRYLRGAGWIVPLEIR